jgi:hypothetical protein
VCLVSQACHTVTMPVTAMLLLAPPTQLYTCDVTNMLDNGNCTQLDSATTDVATLKGGRWNHC